MRIATSAENDLSCLSKSDAGKILKKLKQYECLDNPLREAKALKGEFKGYYRFRIGQYRAIFIKDSKGDIFILHILKILHRKDIYRIK